MEHTKTKTNLQNKQRVEPLWTSLKVDFYRVKYKVLQHDKEGIYEATFWKYQKSIFSKSVPKYIMKKKDFLISNVRNSTKK